MMMMMMIEAMTAVIKSVEIVEKGENE